MDDIDVAFASSEELLVRETLAKYQQGKTQVVSETFRSFFAAVDGRTVHCMFLGGRGRIVDRHTFNRNADYLIIDGRNIVAQSVQFYLKYSKKNDDLKQRIRQWIDERGLNDEPYFPIEN